MSGSSRNHCAALMLLGREDGMHARDWPKGGLLPITSKRRLTGRATPDRKGPRRRMKIEETCAAPANYFTTRSFMTIPQAGGSYVSASVSSNRR